jgi:hypothetical protein
MPATTSGKNTLLTSGAPTAFSHLGALQDLSGTESTGGSYARQALSYAAAAAGQRATNTSVSIPINTGQVIVALAAFDAISAGNRTSYDPYGSTGQPLRGAGVVDTIANDTILSRAHGVTTDDRLFFTAAMGGSLPAGLSATTLYFVRATGLTTDAFTIATTSGGAAVDITSLGTSICWYKTVPNTFASAGNITVASGAYVVDVNGVG